jgi:hypothetical protein
MDTAKSLATRGAQAYINARRSPGETGRYRSGQTGRTVNPLAYAFTGSNPVLPNPYRFFFEPPRFALLPARFAERDFDAPPDFFFPRLLLRADFPPLDFFPRALLPPLLFPRAFEADDFDFFAVFFGAAFLLRPFAAAFAGFFAFATTFFTAFFADAAPELLELAARPTRPPITPPTTVPTGPATLPRTAPVAIPAVCLEIGGIWMFSDDELELSVDC